MNCLKHGYDWPHDKTCPYCDVERLTAEGVLKDAVIHAVRTMAPHKRSMFLKATLADLDATLGRPTEYKGADRSEVAPGDQGTPSKGAQPDAVPGAQDADDSSPTERGEDYMRCLPDVCESLYSWAVNWRDAIYTSNVVKGEVHGQENRDEIATLDEFIQVCKYLGLAGDDSNQCPDSPDGAHHFVCASGFPGFHDEPAQSICKYCPARPSDESERNAVQ